MGCDYHLSCVDCKVTQYLGYGSYSGWVISDSVDGFGGQLERIATHRVETGRAASGGQAMAMLLGQKRNLNALQFLLEHDNHDVVYWSNDWAWEKNGNLVIESRPGREQVIVPGGAGFQKIARD